MSIFCAVNLGVSPDAIDEPVRMQQAVHAEVEKGVRSPATVKIAMTSGRLAARFVMV